MQQVNNTGEEAVYSSEGITPLSLPTVPQGMIESWVREPLNKVDEMNEYDDHPSIDARKAFEMFQGKLYKPRDDSYTARNLGEETRIRESILDKLSRLNEELKDLETDVSKIPSVSSSSVNRIQNTESMAVEQINDSITDLSSRLAALSGSMETSVRSRVKLQKDLTSSIKNEVIKLSSSSTTATTTTQMKAPSSSSSDLTAKVISKSTPGKASTQTSSTVSSPNVPQQNTVQHTHGIVHESYASVPVTKSREDASVSNKGLFSKNLIQNESMESLEKRLRRIENFVGQSNVIGNSSLDAVIHRGTLLQRLVDLEQKVHRIDDKSLQVAAVRAKVIRADLEAAAKARNKLNSSLSNAGDDSKIISSLYEQLLDLEGFFVHSPHSILTDIVQRLSFCANLHSRTMTFEKRLNELEGMANNMNQLVRNVEECLGRVESGIITNMKVMEQNMNALDDRAKALR